MQDRQPSDGVSVRSRLGKPQFGTGDTVGRPNKSLCRLIKIRARFLLPSPDECPPSKRVLNDIPSEYVDESDGKSWTGEAGD